MDLHHDNFNDGSMPDDFRPHFEGTARVQHFPSPFEPGPAVFSVHFDPGARTKPHLHHSGQVLYITEGAGIVADGEGRRAVRAGDVVSVEPDEWHWHGGGRDSAMAHLTIQMPGSDDIEWNVDERDWAAGYDA